MRVFLSSFENFCIAIPIEFVANILIFRGEKDNQNEYVSLPEIFNNKDLNTKHGILLKNSTVIILTTKIDCEIEIPSKEIFPLPKVFCCLQFSQLFSGIKITKKSPILFLNPSYLEKNIEKELL